MKTLFHIVGIYLATFSPLDQKTSSYCHSSSHRTAVKESVDIDTSFSLFFPKSDWEKVPSTSSPYLLRLLTSNRTCCFCSQRAKTPQATLSLPHRDACKGFEALGKVEQIHISHGMKWPLESPVTISLWLQDSADHPGDDGKSRHNVKAFIFSQTIKDSRCCVSTWKLTQEICSLFSICKPQDLWLDRLF